MEIYPACCLCYLNYGVMICKESESGYQGPLQLTASLCSSPSLRPVTNVLIRNRSSLAAATKELHLDHWPMVVRKMAVQLKGLVEGVLKKGAGEEGFISIQ